MWTYYGCLAGPYLWWMVLSCKVTRNMPSHHFFAFHGFGIIVEVVLQNETSLTHLHTQFKPATDRHPALLSTNRQTHRYQDMVSVGTFSFRQRVESAHLSALLLLHSLLLSSRSGLSLVAVTLIQVDVPLLVWGLLKGGLLLLLAAWALPRSASVRWAPLLILLFILLFTWRWLISLKWAHLFF